MLRWKWRRGSTLYLVWQQDKSETATLGDYVNVGDMFSSVASPGPERLRGQDVVLDSGEVGRGGNRH